MFVCVHVCIELGHSNTDYFRNMIQTSFKKNTHTKPCTMCLKTKTLIYNSCTINIVMMRFVIPTCGSTTATCSPNAQHFAWISENDMKITHPPHSNLMNDVPQPICSLWVRIKF